MICVILSVTMLKGVMLSVITLRGVILSVIVLNVVAPLKGLPFVFLVQLRHQSDALK